jgi:hypothetical protein
MKRTHRRAVGVVAALAITAGAASAVGGGTAAADPSDPFCSLTGLTSFTWDGGGDGTTWSDPLNWSGDVAPGTDDRTDGYVCIGGSASVTMEPGDVALVQAFDLDVSAQLEISAGAGLFVYGDPATRASTARGYLEVTGAVGGPGHIDLTGLFGTSATSSDTVLDPAPALAGNPCELFDGLPPAACSRGGELVDLFAVNGYGGLRLLGGYDLVVEGALVPADAGIGMARGSRLVISPGHQLNIHGDGDFFPIGTGRPRPVLVNKGIIRKYRGGGLATDRGVTVISTRYRGDGEIWVEEQDEVVIADGSRRPAEVTAGSILGSGPCRRIGADCRFTTLRQRGKRQSAVLQAPQSQPVSQRALVQVRPRADLRQPGYLGIPYLVHADELHATAATPALIELRYDGRLLEGRTWADVEVFRQPHAGVAWRRVRACRPDGTPRGTAHACVDRRGLAESSRQVPGSGGDAILVVRTTATSRWVGR